MESRNDAEVSVIHLDESTSSDKPRKSVQLPIPVFENDPGSPVSFTDLKLPPGFFPVKSVVSNDLSVNPKSIETSSLIPLAGDSYANIAEESAASRTGIVEANHVVNKPQADELQLILPLASNTFAKKKNKLNGQAKDNSHSKPVTFETFKKELPLKFDDVITDMPITGNPLSWSNGSFGFGSLDIIPQHKLKKSRKSMQSRLSELETPPQRWGWVVMVASWIIMIPIVGIMSSFGVVVSSLTNQFNSTKLEAGWIGSLVFGVTVGLCPLSNVLLLIYGKRCVATIGVVGSAACAIVTSFIPYLTLMILTYSIGLGVFANLVYNSSLTLTGLYFQNKHQALATCFASAGISFGTIVFNPISRILVVHVGWRHTFQVYGGLVLFVGLLCAATFRPPLNISKVGIERQFKGRTSKHKKFRSNSEGFHSKMIGVIKEGKTIKSEELNASSFIKEESKVALALKELNRSVFNKNSFDCTICNEVSFILWMGGTFLWSFTLLFPHIFLIDYMENLGIPPNSGAVVLTVFGVFDLMGRMGCALGARKLHFSFAYIYSCCALINGVTTLLTPFGKELKFIYMYALIVGTNSGIINSLLFAATMQFFGRVKGLHAWGYVNVMLATGMIGGPVFAGGIFDATGSYKIALYLNGLLYVLCSAVMASIPIALSRSPIESVSSKVAELFNNKDTVAELFYSPSFPEYLSRQSLRPINKVYSSSSHAADSVHDKVVSNSENPLSSV